MRVTIEIEPWHDDHRCGPSQEPTALLITNVLFNGASIPHSRAEISWSGPIESGTGIYDFMQMNLRDIPEDLFSGLALNDICMGATAENCCLIISELSIVEAVPAATS